MKSRKITPAKGWSASGRNYSLLITLLLSFWAVRPLFHSGFFPIHDDTQVVRVQQMAQALRDGQLPVRWVSDLGYGFGYPIFNFYAPLAYYFGAFFNLLGFDVLAATKLMFIVGILLSGISMYFLAREFWGEIGGILSGLFYVYAPYRAVDIYVRGAVGEFWAMGFLPLVFLALYKSFDFSPPPRRSPANWRATVRGVFRLFSKWTLIGSLSLAAVILSHNLTAVMLVPFILGFIGYLGFSGNSLKKKLLITSYCLLITFLALGLSAFYWLPALWEMNLTKVFDQIGGGADFRDHFIFLDQLWTSPWGFGGSAPGRLDGMSFMIGKLHLVFLILSLLVGSWALRSGKKKIYSAVLVPFCVFAVAVFLTNKISQPIWELIPLMSFIQYPWRFLIFVTLSVSFMAGSVVRGGFLRRFFRNPTSEESWLPLRFSLPPSEEGFESWQQLLGGTVIILALLSFNTKHFQPQTILGVTVDNYINEENIKWKTSKISDEYLPKDFPVPENKNEVAWEKVAVLAGGAEIKDLVLKSHRCSFNVKAEDKTEILVNTAYFPGWKVWVDRKETDFTLDNGKVKFSLPPGEHQILVHFVNTPIRTVANLISLISWAGLVLFMLKYGGWMRLIWR